MSTNFVNMKGGHSAQFHAAPSITFSTGKEHHVYVKLCKNEAWFLKGVGGINTKKGDLKAVNVFSSLISFLKSILKKMGNQILDKEVGKIQWCSTLRPLFW